jgi:hypothetical protein
MIPISSIKRYYCIVVRYCGLGLQSIKPAANYFRRHKGFSRESRCAFMLLVESRHNMPWRRHVYSDGVYYSSCHYQHPVCVGVNSDCIVRRLAAQYVQRPSHFIGACPSHLSADRLFVVDPSLASPLSIRMGTPRNSSL